MKNPRPKLILGLAFAASIGFHTQAGEAPSISIRILSLELAQRVAMGAVDACRQMGYQVAAAVMDRTGNLLALARDPLAGPHTVKVSQLKAYSAATFVTPTSQMMDNPPLRFIPDTLLVGGGVPIEVGGHLYGAVGVSGAPGRKVSGDIDEECARAGIESIREDLEFAE